MRLSHTEFRGPVGIHHGNVSTAWEVARIVRRTAKDSVLVSIMKKAEHTVKPMRGYLKIYYRNTNPVIRKTAHARFIASENEVSTTALDTVWPRLFKPNDLAKSSIVLLGSRSKISRIYDTRASVKMARPARIKGTHSPTLADLPTWPDRKPGSSSLAARENI